MLPLGALTSLTGGGGLSGSGGASTSGDAKGGTTSGSGISSPIVIGGYKTNGSATAVPQYTVWLVAGAIAFGLFLYFRRR